MRRPGESHRGAGRKKKIRIIAKYAESTLLKYIPQVLTFCQCMSDLGVEWESMCTANVLDILLSFPTLNLDADSDGFSSMAVMKALRWIHNILQLPFLIFTFHHYHHLWIASMSGKNLFRYRFTYFNGLRSA